MQKFHEKQPVVDHLILSSHNAVWPEACCPSPMPTLRLSGRPDNHEESRFWSTLRHEFECKAPTWKRAAKRRMVHRPGYLANTWPSECCIIWYRRGGIPTYRAQPSQHGMVKMESTPIVNRFLLRTDISGRRKIV